MYRCKNNANDYEIYTPEQGIVYLIADAVYILFEAYYTFTLIQICKKEASIKYDPGLVLFYLCIHLVIIRGIIYFLGGVVICYNEYFYDILNTIYFGFKQAVILLFSYRITLLLQYYNVLPKNKILRNSFILLFIIHEIGSISFYIWEAKYDDALPSVIFSGVLYFIISLIFFIVVFMVRSSLQKVSRNYQTRKLMLDWCAVIITMACSVFIDLLEALFRIYQEFLSDEMNLVVSRATPYAIAMAIYYMCTEIVPFYIMMWIFSQDEAEEEEMEALEQWKNNNTIV